MLSDRGPRAANLDSMVPKFFTVPEGRHVQFGVEFQNATNTPTVGTPNTPFELGGFGCIKG